MAVFIKDVIKLCGRKLLIWTILFIVGCIQYVHAAKPTNVTLSVTSGTATEVTGATPTTWKVPASGGNVVLTCEAVDGHKYLFMRNGMNTGAFGNQATMSINPLDKTTTGNYTCLVRSVNGELSDGSPNLILTFACTTTSGDSCIKDDEFAECVGDSSDLYCKCKLAKTGPLLPSFAGCYECIEDEDCTTVMNKPKCSPRRSNPVNSLPQKCVECLKDNSGCDPASKKPRCNATTPNAAVCTACDVANNAGCSGNTPYCKEAGKACQPCNTTDNKPCDTDETCDNDGSCKAKSKSSSVATGPTNTAGTGTGTDSKGTTTQASVTSSAGTVTYTVSVFIASVVVALTN